MRSCRTCRREFPFDPKFCPIDGCPLGPEAGASGGELRQYEAILTILSPPDEGTRCRLEGDQMTLGQSADNGIVLGDPTVSHHHAALRLREGQWRVFDVGSCNGTYVNGTRVGAEGVALHPSDVLTLGQSRLDFSVVPAVVAEMGPVPARFAAPFVAPAKIVSPVISSAPVAPEPETIEATGRVAIVAEVARSPHITAVLPSGEQYATPLLGSELRIGKSADNWLVLKDPSVSHHHAVIRREGDRWLVVDVGSLNGVFVNGKRVGPNGRCLRIGDVITLGHSHLHVSAGPKVAQSESAASRFALPAESPSYVEATLPDGARVVARLEGTALTIGSEAGCGLTLADPEVSHRHATMRREDGWWHVFDAGTKNGTFVNDQRVGPRGYALLADDEVRIGGTRLRLGFGAVPMPTSSF
jgi:pSer/pThr/pTyr-binding forkhead associated (FHA) protein